MSTFPSDKSRPGTPAHGSSRLTEIADLLGVHTTAFTQAPGAIELHIDADGTRWLLVMVATSVVIRCITAKAATDENMTAFLGGDPARPEHAALSRLIERLLIAHLIQ